VNSLDENSIELKTVLNGLACVVSLVSKNTPNESLGTLKILLYPPILSNILQYDSLQKIY